MINISFKINSDLNLFRFIYILENSLKSNLCVLDNEIPVNINTRIHGKKLYDYLLDIIKTDSILYLSSTMMQGYTSSPNGDKSLEESRANFCIIKANTINKNMRL